VSGNEKFKQFPIPRLAQQLVEEWAEELSAQTGHTVEELRQNYQCFDFPNGILRIELMDESAVEFHWALHLVNEHRKAIAVFTEHCGHHVFPYHEAKVYRDGALIYDQRDA
jgi:hypothetical protein